MAEILREDEIEEGVALERFEALEPIPLSSPFVVEEAEYACCVVRLADDHW